MSILKKGTCSSSVTTSNMVYVCKNCGYTEIAMSKSSKKCQRCRSDMVLLSSDDEEKSTHNAPNLV
jgi:hypothetical protein